MEKSRFIAPAAPTRQGCSSAQRFQLKARIINQCSWAQSLAAYTISSSEPRILQGLNQLLLLCDGPFSPLSGGFTSYLPSSPVMEWIMPLLREKATKNLLHLSPASAPRASHHTLISPRALPAILHCRLSEHHRVKSSLVPCCLCAFSFSNAHTHAQKREGMSGTSAVTIWQKHGSIFWQLYQGLRTIISVPDSSTGDRRSSYISLQPSTLIQFSLSQPCWNFTLPH